MTVARLMQGDCLERMGEIESGSVDMVLCDLPYGTTQNKWDSIIPLDELWSEYDRVCRGPVILFAQTPFDKILGVSNIKKLKYEWIWRKENATGFLNAKLAPMKNHENILVFYSQKPNYQPQMRQGFRPYKRKQGRPSSNYGLVNPEHVTESDGSRFPVTVLDFVRDRDRDRVHPTQKPVALLEYLIRTYTNEGETVLDNTMGSGSTGVAAMNTGRKFIGIERDETYFRIAEERIEKAKLDLFAPEVA